MRPRGPVRMSPRSHEPAAGPPPCLGGAAELHGDGSGGPLLSGDERCRPEEAALGVRDLLEPRVVERSGLPARGSCCRPRDVASATATSTSPRSVARSPERPITGSGSRSSFSSRRPWRSEKPASTASARRRPASTRTPRSCSRSVTWRARSSATRASPLRCASRSTVHVRWAAAPRSRRAPPSCPCRGHRSADGAARRCRSGPAAARPRRRRTPARGPRARAG